METEAREKRGQLTIFVSYAPGAGKTAAMLHAADQFRHRGMDVVACLGNNCRDREAAALLETFEKLTPVKAPDSSKASFPLDQALERRPQLLLTDELSSPNPEGCRHQNRYQDISELLTAGISVYTTLNIGHIESLQDTVAAIIGHPVADRIPDRAFDQADRVEFIDKEPSLLCQDGPNGPETPKELARLEALRELSLRRCAERLSQRSREKGSPIYRTGEHIMVCLSSSPSNARIIRTASRMAHAFRCMLTALFVETRATEHMTEANRARLQANIRLAEQLGASVETVYGDDIPAQIAEFARIAGVTKIVMGRSSSTSGPALLKKTPLTDRLIALLPSLDIHIIPDGAAKARPKAVFMGHFPRPAVLLRDFLKSFLLLVLATVIGVLFDRLGFTEANIITIYILSVMLTAVVTQSQICGLLASGFSVLTFNFFFTDPRFSLQAYDSGYPITFIIMFVAALITGSLASRLKTHAERSAQVAWRTRLLFETNQSLQKAEASTEIMAITAMQLNKLFNRMVTAYLVEQNELHGPRIFASESPSLKEKSLMESERKIAEWVWKNNRRAGAGTQTFSHAACLYLSVRIGAKVYGVIGIEAGKEPLDAFEKSILLSVLGECALALENRRNAEEKEAAAIMAKNEQLRANLLRSISHDLRTPLTSISGNASNLLSNGALFDEETKAQMYGDIYDDSMWLINLVENLLSISKFEENRMQLHLSPELMEDVVAEALRHVDRRSSEYNISVHSAEDYILAQIDAKLIMQVLINIIDDAIKYTPPGSDIAVTIAKKQDKVLVSVADNGPGIPDEAKPHIFEMFYSAASKAADSRRSLGLGLSLCKSIINAHGGEITVADNRPSGTIFTFTLLAGEVNLNE